MKNLLIGGLMLTAAATSGQESGKTSTDIIPQADIYAEYTGKELLSILDDADDTYHLEECSEADFAKCMKEQLECTPITLETGGSFYHDKLGHRSIRPKEDINEDGDEEKMYILSIDGEEYIIKTKGIKLENFYTEKRKREYNNDKDAKDIQSDIQFVFDTKSIIIGTKIISMQEMIDPLYKLYKINQKHKRGEKTTNKLSIYKKEKSILGVIDIKIEARFERATN